LRAVEDRAASRRRLMQDDAGGSTMSLKGLYINLDRSEERRVHVERQLLKLGAAHGYQRFAAIDGARLTARPGIKNPAELGCYLSHLEAIRKNRDFEGWLHVLEDDVVISRPAAAALAAFTSDAAFASYDIIFTNVMLQVSSESMGLLRTFFDNTVNVDDVGRVTGIKNFVAFSLETVHFHLATSYLINPRAIGRVADLLADDLANRPFTPVDDVLAKYCRSGELTGACSMPFYTVPRLSGESTIRGGVTHCRLSQMVMETAFYADRDVAALWRVLHNLGKDNAPSVTSALLAEANRVLIARDMPAASIQLHSNATG
jgi:GR25 family glycosyltransferase involved in LPS biosynthesis